ncbi:hypothetical protein VTI74DRAFT_9235 [Chaetomium olivicolor]
MDFQIPQEVETELTLWLERGHALCSVATRTLRHVPPPSLLQLPRRAEAKAATAGTAAPARAVASQLHPSCVALAQLGGTKRGNFSAEGPLTGRRQTPRNTQAFPKPLSGPFGPTLSPSADGSQRPTTHPYHCSTRTVTQPQTDIDPRTWGSMFLCQGWPSLEAFQEREKCYV